jgi:hypothetical protein
MHGGEIVGFIGQPLTLLCPRQHVLNPTSSSFHRSPGHHVEAGSLAEILVRRSGRPALAVDVEPVTVRMTTAALARLDDWRREQRDLPSRPEAIRRLTELGFAGLGFADPRGTAA